MRNPISCVVVMACSLAGAAFGQEASCDKDRSEVSWGLLADFLDGMLDACPAETKIVDAWKGAYTYKQEDQFRNA